MDSTTATLPQPLFRRAVELLRELTAISSDSGDPAGLRRMAERLAAALQERGLATEIRDEATADGRAPRSRCSARGERTSRAGISC